MKKKPVRQDKKKRPLLSICMIFKNEIRCLERCLKSLEPLREKLSCELVMADTGSDDGSREIAEKYADVLFDFPWISDFAAARNAVMDRCSGRWCLTMDADEWMDEDLDELLAFFNKGICDKYDGCALMERNYYSYDLKGGYGMFMTWRMLRMSTGLRYKGAIHESWDLSELRLLVFRRTMLHHDGYVEMNGPGGRDKRDRNLTLIREKLEKEPDNLLTRLQFIESGSQEPDYVDSIYKTVEMVENRARAWDTLGGSILRYAIGIGRAKNLPETEKWLHEAEEWFPNSYFIRMDAAFNGATFYLDKENYDECIHWGEMGVQAYKDYGEGKGDIGCQLYGSLQTSTPLCEASLKVVLSRGYFEKGRVEDAVKLLSGIDFTILDALWTKNLLETLHMIHHRSNFDITPLVTAFWEGINKPEPAQDWADRRRDIVFKTGTASFAPAYRRKEEASEGFCRYVCTMYKPLAGQCALGTAAAIVTSGSLSEMASLLATVEKWDELPIFTVLHALEAGVTFPVAGRPMKIEELDRLATRLAGEPEALAKLLQQSVEKDFASDWQSLIWTHSLAQAAVQNCTWEDTEAGTELARTFASVEETFLPRCYTAEVLNGDGLYALPPLYRFGWYCAQAFYALDAGDLVGYVQLLREGLSCCESMKPMVKFLTDCTPQLQVPPPSPELLALAEQVRAMLAAYPADDPAVAALKASPAYQKVAYLLEEE